MGEPNLHRTIRAFDLAFCVERSFWAAVECNLVGHRYPLVPLYALARKIQSLIMDDI